MPESNMPTIERSKPQGTTHPLASAESLSAITEQNLPKQEVVRLVDYLRDIAGKPRGNATGGKEDLNSHSEEFIVKEGDEIRLASLSQLQELFAAQGLPVEILGVQSIGNPNQRVEAVVQGVDRNKPASGFERPTLAEGPHMILAPFAVDKKGELHIFRTIQMRTGEAMIDTPRGFADAKALESGQQMYDVENAGDNVVKNMRRIVAEESGDALKIKKITFYGAHRVNSAFVVSKSAIFAVEVDYDAFIANKKVVSLEELARRKEQFEHEGLVGDVLDIPLSQYNEYLKDSDISKDMATEFGDEAVAIDYLAKQLAQKKKILTELGKMRKTLKKADPAEYARHMAVEATVMHPEKAQQIGERTDNYIKTLPPTGLRRKLMSLFGIK